MTDRTKLKLLIASTLGLAALVMLGLPALFLLLPDPSPRQVTSLAEAGRGAYVTGDGVAWRLFPRASALDAAPVDAPVLRRPGQVLVAARQTGELAAYRLRLLGGAELPLEPTLRRDGRLTSVVIDAGGLADGTYEVTMPRESIYGGSDFAYFRVSR